MIPVLVTSGKGGVGKSTVSINLAYAIAARGIRVSLLDADLMAPDLHLMLPARPDTIREHGKMLEPIKVADRIEFMGLGAFVPRGVGIALNYDKTMDFVIMLLRFVKWSGDYLIIDSPPSSVDVNVRLLNELEGKARAVIVGEPHPFALEDNLRMLDLLRFYNIDVRAVVLNKYNLFSQEVAARAEAEYGKLGVRIVKVPWDPELQVRPKPEVFNELVGVVA
jgi:ATP-binding protein involved in chromosome partitioning